MGIEPFLLRIANFGLRIVAASGNAWWRLDGEPLTFKLRRPAFAEAAADKRDGHDEKRIAGRGTPHQKHLA